MDGPFWMFLSFLSILGNGHFENFTCIFYSKDTGNSKTLTEREKTTVWAHPKAVCTRLIKLCGEVAGV